MKISVIKLLIVLLLLPFILFSQQENPEEELKNIQRISNLTPEHSFLHTFEGKWKIKGLSYTSESQMPVTGTADIRIILNGHYIEFDITLGELDLAANNRIFIGFDTRFNKFTLFSIDDFSNSGLYTQGVKKGNILEFKGNDYSLFEKKDIPFRITITKERENKLSYKIYNTLNGREVLMLEYYFFKE